MRKKVLILCTGCLGVFTVLAIYGSLQIRATPVEQTTFLPGDDLIPHPIGAVNHAITIARPPRAVWPWLAQMGSGRAGWYAYDFIDNGGHRSSSRILPQYQNISAGTIMPALPGVKDVFLVARCDPERNLVLAWFIS